MKKIMEPQLRPPERTSSNNQYNFVNIRPGGNNTSLVMGIIEDPTKRIRINDEIMSLYPESSSAAIEQVGFVNISDPNNPELMMAGGEFCGNATRSAAFLALGGDPGDTTVKVRLKNEGIFRLKAGVTQTGESYSQMPIYSRPDQVKNDPEDPRNTFVFMRGITQYVDWDTSKIEGKTPEEIKEIGLKIMRDKRLGDYCPDASGVMFAKKTEKGIEITPVVYVNMPEKEGPYKYTLFLETACGSGTTAVGMALAKERRSSISEVPIYQPSGMPIKISVDYDGKEYSYAQIQGPVEMLNSGTLIETGNGPVVIEKISSTDQLAPYIESGELEFDYNSIFGTPPYGEVFSSEVVASDFNQYVTEGALFFARSADKLIGFGAALPLSSTTKVAEIAYGRFPLDSTQYMADLGVLEPWRKKGIGKTLIKERLNSFAKGTTVLMRTSEKNKDSQKLYKELGFVQVEEMEQMVTQKRVSGEDETDRRIFFSKVI